MNKQMNLQHLPHPRNLRSREQKILIAATAFARSGHSVLAARPSSSSSSSRQRRVIIAELPQGSGEASRSIAVRAAGDEAASRIHRREARAAARFQFQNARE